MAAADLDAILSTLDSRAIVCLGDRTRGWLDAEDEQTALSGYAVDRASRQQHEEILVVRRGTLPKLEAKDRPEGTTLTIDGVTYRVLSFRRVGDGQLQRLAVAAR